MSNLPPKSALVLSGGGARGAYQVGVLAALADRLPPGARPFSILTGVSVGALNAAFLGARSEDFIGSVRRLEAIWRSLTCEQVFRTDVLAIAATLGRWAAAALLGWAGVHPPRALLDNAPLGGLLRREVDFGRLNDLIGKEGLDAIAITASSYHSGRAVTFYNATKDIEPWRRARRVGLRCDIEPKHILASSALPFVFPAVRLGGSWFGDGALRENAPLSSAIHLGCDRIVTIGARDGDPDPILPGEVDTYPGVGEIAGQLLDIVFNDDLDTDVERLARINQTISRLPEAEREASGLRPIEFLSIVPGEDVRPLAGTYARELPASVRFVLQLIGALKPPFVLPSYLNFEQGYVGALIDLGRADAERQMDRLLTIVGLD